MLSMCGAPFSGAGPLIAASGTASMKALTMWSFFSIRPEASISRTAS